MNKLCDKVVNLRIRGSCQLRRVANMHSSIHIDSNTNRPLAIVYSIIFSELLIENSVCDNNVSRTGRSLQEFGCKSTAIRLPFAMAVEHFDTQLSIS